MTHLDLALGLEVGRIQHALLVAVLLWVAGFDTIYACQDTEFDRAAGLHSLPARLGTRRALALSRVFHALMLAVFVVPWAWREVAAKRWHRAWLLAAPVAFSLIAVILGPVGVDPVWIVAGLTSAALSVTRSSANGSTSLVGISGTRRWRGT